MSPMAIPFSISSISLFITFLVLIPTLYIIRLISTFAMSSLPSLQERVLKRVPKRVHLLLARYQETKGESAIEIMGDEEKNIL